MKTQGVSFRHAVEILQQDNPTLAAKTVKHSSTPKVSSFLAADEVEKSDDAVLLGKVVEYYHQCLLDSPEALDYLKQRGLDNPEAIKTFKLGYANRTLGYRLPHKNRAEGKLIRERLQALGVFRESGHEHFTGSLVIPVLDEHGRVQELYGRKLLGNRLRKGTPIHTYLPGEHQGLLNPVCLRATEEIILCESLIDALTFWVNGFKNVTASYGTHGFTDDHLAALKQYTIKRVLIAYDNDKAGNEAAAKLTKILTAEGIDCFRIEVPKGMDINEYALAVQPAQKSLSLVIRQAVWLGNGHGKAGQGKDGERPDITTHAENAPAELSTIEALGDSLVDVDTGEVLDTPKTASSLAASDDEPANTKVMPSVADSLTFTEQGNDLLVALDNLTVRKLGEVCMTLVLRLKQRNLWVAHEVDILGSYSD